MSKPFLDLMLELSMMPPNRSFCYRDDFERIHLFLNSNLNNIFHLHCKVKLYGKL